MKNFFLIPLLSIVLASCSTEDNNVSAEQQSKTATNSPNKEIDDSYVLKREDILSQSSLTWQSFYSITRICTFPPGDCMPDIVIVKEKDLVPKEQIQEYISIADLKNEYAQNNLDLIVEHNEKSNIYFYKFQNKKDSLDSFVIQFKTN